LNFESSEGVAFRKENNSQMSSERTDITREPTFPETAGHDSACNIRHRVQETQCMVMIQLISFLKMKTILNCLVRLWGLYEVIKLAHLKFLGQMLLSLLEMEREVKATPHR